MDDKTIAAVHFLLSKLVIFAVPLLNTLLAQFGINVTTSNSTADNLANMMCIGVGLAYSAWAHANTATVHTQSGFADGVDEGLKQANVISVATVPPLTPTLAAAPLAPPPAPLPQNAVPQPPPPPQPK